MIVAVFGKASLLLLDGADKELGKNVLLGRTNNSHTAAHILQMPHSVAGDILHTLVGVEHSLCQRALQHGDGQ